MEITGVLVEKIGQKFKPHLSTSESKVAVNAGCALIRTCWAHIGACAYNIVHLVSTFVLNILTVLVVIISSSGSTVF